MKTKDSILFLKTLLILFMILHTFNSSAVPAAGQKTFPSWLAEFENTPAWARPQIFFVWNGNVNKQRVAEMLQQYEEEGIGGVFIHPRPGLITEYLSAEWFELWRYTLDECKRLGMECHIYDENGFPSGFASGEVMAANPDLAAHYITALKITKPLRPASEKALAYFVLTDPNTLPRRVSKEAIDKTTPQNPVWAIVVRQLEASHKHGGFPYPDVLRRETAEAFIEVTHDKYADHFESDFDKTIKYVFTDEPDMPGAKGLPWSDNLLKEFNREHGYDLLSKIGPLCFGGPGSTVVRFDYYKTVTRLWIDNFIKPIYQWCERHDLAFTGHLWEHEWPTPQKQPVVMHTYRWMQAPGTDLLGFHFFPTKFEDQLLAYLNQKELSSIGNQLGYEKLLCESSGAGGYGMALREFKPLEDFLLANGVSVMTPHLSYQTLAGSRKYDWPQTISDHAPWWDSYDLQSRHVGRVVYALSQGKEDNRFLVLHPDTSGWIHHQHKGFLLGREPKENKLKQLKDSQCRFLGKLHSGQIDFDLGDELTIAELGSIDGNRLRVGKATYEAVVIPPGMDNWMTATYRRMQEYLRVGGVVYACSEPPVYIDGRRSSKAKALARKHADQWKPFSDAGELTSALRKAYRPFISRSDGSPLPNGLCWQRRVRPDGSIIYFFCHPWDESFRAEVRVEGHSLYKLDTVNGAMSEVASSRTDDGQTFTLELPRYGHALFVASPQALSGAVAKRDQELRKVELTQESIEPLKKNVFVLLFCDLKVGDTVAKGVNTTVADQTNWKAHGCDKNIWSQSSQFRRTLIDKQFPPDSGFNVSYHFTVEPNSFDTVRETLEVAIERPRLYTITLNDTLLDFSDAERWFDPNIRRTRIGRAVHKGANTLELTAKRMHPLCEIMPLYVLGEFSLDAAKSGFSITRSERLTLGYWKDQGLPFYAGKVKYRYSFSLEAATNKVVVSLPKWNGSAARVKIDSDDVGVIAWPPDCLELDKPLDAGGHTLEVIVAGNLKNMMGPHFSDGLPGIWSWIWSGRTTQPPEKYKFFPSGLVEAPQLSASH